MKCKRISLWPTGDCMSLQSETCRYWFVCHECHVSGGGGINQYRGAIYHVECVLMHIGVNIRTGRRGR